MTNWQWECFDRYTHSGMLEVADAGPLLSPISTFKIARNSKLDLILETLVIGEAHASNALDHPIGTVWHPTGTVEFTGNNEIRCTAHGVLPFSTNATVNAELVKETKQKSQIHSLTARLQNDVPVAYTIDWLGNLNRGSYVWNGVSLINKQETVDTLTLGSGSEAIELSANGLSSNNMNFSGLEMVIAGVRLFLFGCASDVSQGVERPGFIFYVGDPTDEVRTKIRQILSFCLGNYLIYFGSTMLSERSEIVSLSAISPPSIGNMSEIIVVPPAPLFDGERVIAEQHIIARMANAIYAHYDELEFNSFSWAYWHARCAPVHMAAVHYGAAIEGLRRSYMDAHPERLNKNLITDGVKWKTLKDSLLKEIDATELESEVKTILTNKVNSNLNQTPQSVLSEKMLDGIGIRLGEVERDAWKSRHVGAHGGEMDFDFVITTIRNTKLLKIVLHRIILKITGASDLYFDDYTIGHAIRNVAEPIPSPSSTSG